MGIKGQTLAKGLLGCLGKPETMEGRTLYTAVLLVSPKLDVQA